MNFHKNIFSFKPFFGCRIWTVQLSDETSGIAPNLPPSIDAGGPLNEVDSEEMELPALARSPTRKNCCLLRVGRTDGAFETQGSRHQHDFGYDTDDNGSLYSKTSKLAGCKDHL